MGDAQPKSVALEVLPLCGNALVCITSPLAFHAFQLTLVEFIVASSLCLACVVIAVSLKLCSQ